MEVLRSRAPWWIATGLGLLLSWLASAAPALAGTAALDVGDQAVVNVIVRGRGNAVTVRVWDRKTVQIDAADDTPPAVDRRSIVFGGPNTPLVQQIPPALYQVRDPHDPPGAPPSISGALPPEGFPYADFRPGPHDVIHVDAPENSHLVIMVPASTGILSLRVGMGQTTVDGFHGANLFMIQGAGRVELTGTATTAFVQMNYGTLYAADDTFDRIRVRGVAAHDVFEHCRTKQIEATSITGSIVFDGGSFDPGLARFESQTGNIALGVTAPAQLTGRSEQGHVYTLFDRKGITIDQRADGDATASVGNGGPLVNAISGKGNVYFYDGTLMSRRGVAPEWRPVHQLFTNRRRTPASTSVAPPRPEDHPIKHLSEFRRTRLRI
ncbi:MAG: hypothetical protein JOZ86_11870 [Candidatus Eremiobacteraeota bacterium]|nr:hypothetical protein [Candidatus Eremiobacteraeota bacterium]